MATTLQLFSLAYPVTALGPGNRLVLWVAGCGRGCEDCISPEMQPYDAGKPVPVPVLLRHVLGIESPLDGMTVSGGEPFDQAAPLAELLAALHRERPTWDVIVYSGYSREDLQPDRTDPTDHARLLDQVDILIDGPFIRSIPRRHPLTGSGNQRVWCLTDRARALKPLMESLPAQQANLGLGNGTLDMVIGVTEAATRKIVCDSLHAEALNACDTTCGAVRDEPQADPTDPTDPSDLLR